MSDQDNLFKLLLEINVLLKTPDMGGSNYLKARSKLDEAINILRQAINGR